MFEFNKFTKQREVHTQANIPYYPDSEEKEYMEWVRRTTHPIRKEPYGPTKYVVYQLRRVRDIEYKEWLDAHVELIRPDALGNPFKTTIDPFFRWKKANVTYRHVHNADTNHTTMETEGISGYDFVYQLPFTTENATKLYSNVNRLNCTLVVVEAESGKAPVLVRTFDQFINWSFDELMEGKRHHEELGFQKQKNLNIQVK